MLSNFFKKRNKMELDITKLKDENRKFININKAQNKKFEELEEIFKAINYSLIKLKYKEIEVLKIGDEVKVEQLICDNWPILGVDYECAIAGYRDTKKGLQYIVDISKHTEGIFYRGLFEKNTIFYAYHSQTKKKIITYE